MEFSYYEPVSVVLYSLFLMIVYILFAIIVGKAVLQTRKKISIIFLILSFIPILYAIYYQISAGFYSDQTTFSRFPEYIFSFDFITICIPAYIFLIIAYMLSLNTQSKS